MGDPEVKKTPLSPISSLDDKAVLEQELEGKKLQLTEDEIAIEEYNRNLHILDPEYADFKLRNGCVLVRMYRREVKRTGSNIIIPAYAKEKIDSESGYNKVLADSNYPYQLNGIVVNIDQSLIEHAKSEGREYDLKVGQQVQVTTSAVMLVPDRESQTVIPANRFNLWYHADKNHKANFSGYGYLLLYPRDIIAILKDVE